MNSRAIIVGNSAPSLVNPNRLSSRSVSSGLPAIKRKQNFPRHSRTSPSARSVLVLAAKTAYICIDCGWIYDGREPFDSLPSSFKCPVCKAPKRRFKATAQGGANTKAAMDARFASLKGTKSSSASASKSDPPIAALAAGGVVILALAYFLGNAALS